MSPAIVLADHQAVRGLSRCANCGAKDETRSPRREGKLWFCSQACFLEHESRRGRAWRGHTPSAPRRAVRVIGKTIKWVVVAIVLLVVAGVIAVVVGIGRAVSDSEKSAKHASAGFAHVKRGMSSAYVRRLLGKPDDWERYRERGVREICWYYGSFAVKRGEFEFCFRRGKLISKSRFSG